MTAFITYRTSITPTVPTSTTATATVALTHAQLDGNFKSIVNELANKADSTSVTTIAQDQALALAIALG